MPKWICKLPEVKTETGAYGLGIDNTRNAPSLQLDLAQLHGRSQIATAIKTQITNDLIAGIATGNISDSTEVTQTEVTQIADAVRITRQHSAAILSGSRMLHRFTDKDGTLYVSYGVHRCR